MNGLLSLWFANWDHTFLEAVASFTTEDFQKVEGAWRS